MIVLGIVLALLFLLLLTPVGVAAAFLDGVLSLAVKLGPFRLTLLPRKKKGDGGEKREKKKPKKSKKPEKSQEEKKKTSKQKLSREDITGIVKLALKALGRFRRHLSLDELMLHVTVATGDPYDTVLRYGAVNAALGAFLPLLHRAFKIRREDIGTAMDFEQEKLAVQAKLTATLRVWEILHIAFCAAGSFLLWMHRRKKRRKQEQAVNEAEKGT